LSQTIEFIPTLSTLFAESVDFARLEVWLIVQKKQLSKHDKI